MSANVLDLPITSSTEDTTDSLGDELPPVGPVICYRDPADVRMIRRQSWLIIISLLLQRSPLLASSTKQFSDPIAL